LVKALAPVWATLPKSRNNAITNKFRQLHRFARGARLNNRERYWQWAGFADEKTAKKLLSVTSLQQLAEQNYQSYKHDLLKYIPYEATMNDFLLTDTLMVLPDDMLYKVDRMSMANSLEVRVPFLDHEVVEFALSLPEDAKIDNHMRKKIVQDSYREILPESLYNRPKKGFEVPLLKWFRAEMKSMIAYDLLEDRFIVEQGIFNIQEVKRLKKKLFSANPGDVHARIWGLIVFQHWWKRYMQ
ncbi:MAG: asparagine synthase-related protein, partial [Fulvivirga sp.]|nr:asparagine synthase-related protein [Fulvivirga sp.]